jgi:hypothetical protein
MSKSYRFTDERGKREPRKDRKPAAEKRRRKDALRQEIEEALEECRKDRGGE